MNDTNPKKVQVGSKVTVRDHYSTMEFVVTEIRDGLVWGKLSGTERIVALAPVEEVQNLGWEIS